MIPIFMAINMEPEISLRMGTAWGTVFSIIPTLFSEDILRTVILAVVGAVISFSATLLLKWLVKLKRK